MIDTHVHFNSPDLAADLPGTIARAEAAGVTRFVVIGFDIASSGRAVQLAAGDNRIFAVVGVHPHDAKQWNDAAADALREWAAHPRVVAIGEIGLDYYRDLSPRDAQETAFRAQIALAQQVKIPLVIHCRDAYEETMAILEAEAGDLTVILHCFAGDAAHAARAFQRGWYLGIGGSLTYKKNDALREIVRKAPASALLLETDAPYLSPEPLRGRYPNEPARLPLVAEKIAALRAETRAEVAAYTGENAERAFRI